MNKKAFLTIGSVPLVVVPIASVVSCHSYFDLNKIMNDEVTRIKGLFNVVEDSERQILLSHDLNSEEFEKWDYKRDDKNEIVDKKDPKPNKKTEEFFMTLLKTEEAQKYYGNLREPDHANIAETFGYEITKFSKNENKIEISLKFSLAFSGQSKEKEIKFEFNKK